MADIEFYEDDSDDKIDTGDDGSGLGYEDYPPDPDAGLTLVQKIEKYYADENMYTRQMMARSLLEAVRSIEVEDEAEKLLKVIARLAEDQEAMVRAELMEQVPHIAMYCQDNQDLFGNPIPTYILPIVVRYLTDSNNQVRKTSQAALLVLLEQDMIQKGDVEEQVCPVILDLAQPESIDDFRTEAVALMSKLAPLIGKVATERIFLDRFSEMCTDALFHVRKVCATNFGDFCQVVGQHATEQILMPRFYYLCEDAVWGVRKCCAECFMQVSCVCCQDVRRSDLAQLFVNLICDQSRWVRMAAFQALGAFISTFADPQVTGLYVNDEGILTVGNAADFQRLRPDGCTHLDESPEGRIEVTEGEEETTQGHHNSADKPSGCDNPSATTPSSQSHASSNHLHHNSSSGDSTTPGSTGSTTATEKKDEEKVEDVAAAAASSSSLSPSSGIQVEGSSTNSSSALEEEGELGVTSMDTSEDQASDSAHLSYALPVSVEEQRSAKFTRDSTSSSQASISSQNVDAVIHTDTTAGAIGNVDSTSSMMTTTTEGSSVSCSDGNILASLSSRNSDMQPAGDTKAACPADTESRVTDSSRCRADHAVPAETSGEVVAEHSPTPTAQETNSPQKPGSQTQNSSLSAFNAFNYWRTPVLAVDARDMSLQDEEETSDRDLPPGEHPPPGKNPDRVNKVAQQLNNTSLNELHASPTDDDETTEASMMHTACVTTVRESAESSECVTNIGSTHVLGHHVNETTMTVINGVVQDVSSSSLGYCGDEDSSSLSAPPHPSDQNSSMDDSTHNSDQDVIPQALLDHYLSMTDPSRAQSVDSEIAKHCAYSLPAVAYTLGRRHWPCLRELYETLSADMQWKVRRTLAFSIHELALIVGEEVTCRDLVPIFNGFIGDLDEVRIGVLKHLGDFLKLLRPPIQKDYLTKLADFLNTDNNRNWRFREELAFQLGPMLSLYKPSEIHEYLLPVTLTLSEDTVSAVRQAALTVLSQAVLRFLTDQKLYEDLVGDICQRFASSHSWGKRQMFVQICDDLLHDSSLGNERFATDLLPTLLDLSKDPIPNVRISLSRTLSRYIVNSEFYTSAQNPNHDLLLQAIQRLKADSDRDVRYYLVNPPEVEYTEELMEDTIPV